MPYAVEYRNNYEFLRRFPNLVHNNVSHSTRNIMTFFFAYSSLLLLMSILTRSFVLYPPVFPEIQHDIKHIVDSISYDVYVHFQIGCSLPLDNDDVFDKIINQSLPQVQSELYIISHSPDTFSPISSLSNTNYSRYHPQRLNETALFTDNSQANSSLDLHTNITTRVYSFRPPPDSGEHPFIALFTLLISPQSAFDADGTFSHLENIIMDVTNNTGVYYSQYIVVSESDTGFTNFFFEPAMIVREERTSRMHYLNKIITSLVTWLTPPSSFSLPKNIIFWLLVSVALSILLTSSLSLYATCLSRAQAKLTTLSEMFMHRDLASYSGVVPWISINFELNFEAVLLDSLMFVFSFPAFFILMSVGMRGRTEVELDSVVVDQMLTAMTLLLITFQAASILFLHQQTMNAFHRRVFVLFFLFFFVNFAVEKKRGYMKLQSIIVGSLAVTAIVMEMAFGLEMDLSDADVERVDRVLSRFWRAQEDTEEVEEFRREEGMTLEAEEEIVRGRSGTVEREEE